MECVEHINFEEEDDLLSELPELSATFDRNNKTSINEGKDDSGLEISDSMEILKENIENQLLDEIGGDTNDVPSMPELVPLPVLSTSLSGEYVEENNLQLDEGLPELRLLTSMHQGKKENTVSENNSYASVDDISRRSSTSSSFIDSLLDKLRGNNSESSGSEISPKKAIPESKSSDDDLLVEINTSVSFTKSENPKVLPTPIVENQQISSVFVNSATEYEAVVERNKQKKFTRCEDKARMTAKSQPPRMKQPKLPENIQHPRTLAEKRSLLANNLNFLTINQESKIFKQIQRKMNGRDINYQIIDNILDEEIPIKHGPWKALAWLRTIEGNFIQQYISIDDQTFKLCGSKGNHRTKFLPPQSCKPFPKIQTTSLRSVRCCEGGKVKKRIIDNLVNVESIKKFILEGHLSPYRRLETKCLQLSAIKPRPLTKKIEYINKTRRISTDEDSLYLGDFEKFQMPDVKLEVKPHPKVPIDSKVKQYLNEIIPYRDMNENWINFSLSALVVKKEEKEEDQMAADMKSDETFEFKIPYVQNQQHILARRIVKAAENVDSDENFTDDMAWTFCKNCDKDDPIEMEVIDILKDLTNSVCLNLNDDLFTKDDPDVRIPTFIAPVKTMSEIQKLTTASKNLKTDQSKKMLLELRRLNANVVKSDSAQVDDEEDIRRHAIAHLAKDERELRQTVIVTESDTVLLSNKKTETRRQKRAPKRFSDYATPNAIDQDEKEESEPPKKFKPKELQDEPFKTRAQPNETSITLEELKTLKTEVRKWTHVNVEINRLENLDDIQPWCMLHNLYKCSCSKMIIPATSKMPSFDEELEKGTIFVDVASAIDSKIEKESEILDIIEDSESSDDSMEVDENEDVKNENARRVMPVEWDRPRISVCEVADDMEEENKENAPKMEILNISELVNGRIGPIYINIYDTKVNRLNPIFRSILNNQSALVYVDGLGYYVDLKRIDVMKLKFDKIKDELDHPIFIIRPKHPDTSHEQNIFSGDFVNLLFKDDSEALLQIKDKKLLSETAKIIEVILQSVRKKIETQIGCDPTDFVKEQLSLITRDRSNSNTSASSADTSPLHFNGQKLECAPSPGFDTQIMNEFNRVFSMRMQKLCAIIRSNSLGLHPLDMYINKFYIYKWKLLLQSFEEDLINVWQVKITKDEDYFTYVITDTTEPPRVEDVEHDNIVNVKQLALNKTSMLIRMILLKMENSKTNNMTVLLFGCKGYFRICGLMNSKENYFDGVSAKPSRDTHPRLTAKIQKVYNIWYGLKYSSVEKKLQPIKEETYREVEDVQAPENKEKNVKVVPKVNLIREAIANEIINDTKNPSTYKWFLFNVSNDFSDIYIKQWKNYLSHNVVMDAINKAKTKQQTVRILGPLNSAKDNPRIFALPGAPLRFKKNEDQNMTGNFLLFGPYLRNSNSNLLLMQNVNGKMYLRDDYELKYNIKRASKTRCLWIYANTLKCVTETVIESIQPNWDIRPNRVDEGTKILRSNSDDQRKSLKISSIVGGFRKVL